MKRTEYIVQVDIEYDKMRWFDMDKRGNDKKGAVDSWRSYKRTGVLPKVRLIERTTIEKRLR